MNEVDPTHAALVCKVIQWLKYSTRPLYLSELAELSTIDPVSQKFDPNRRLLDTEDIISLCPSSLVTTTPLPSSTNTEDTPDSNFSDKHVHLAQSPVSLFPPEKSHAAIAEDCLAYLRQFDRPYTQIPETVKASPLLRYATNYWADHARLAGPELLKAQLMPPIMEFFHSETVYRNWTAFVDGYAPFGEGEEKEVEGEVYTRSPRPLYYASAFGLTPVVEELIRRDGFPLNTGGPAGSALAAARICGRMDVVAVLEKGASVNVQV